MNPFFESREAPDKTAIIVGERTMSYRALDLASRALAEALRELGLERGDGIAILAPNVPEFFIAAWAAQRSGLYYTPIGSHLKAGEIGYILADSGAKALLVEKTLAPQAIEAIRALAPNAAPFLFSLGGSVTGARPVEELTASARAFEDVEGGDLLYTSGTTGRPKGVKRPLEFGPLGSDTHRVTRLRDLFEMDRNTVFYTPAPIYHAAPLRFAMTVLRMGATLVMDEKFEPRRALATIAARNVTHSQWVPTMFVRLLALSDAERTAFRAPAHRKAIHSGAPCAVSVKRAMIDWWGPILHEYYSGTESAGFTHVTSQQWLRFPGTVGKPWGCKTHILSDAGAELEPGEIGAVYFEGRAGLAYHNDEEKTREAQSVEGWVTMGDIGFVNDEGYLFLCDRKNFVIVSGGVNIYPKEIEEVLEGHPAVLEAAVFGLPDETFGECVQAVVQVRDPVDARAEVADALHAHVRMTLAAFKAPKKIAFEHDLPRLPSGKLEKRRLRDAYRDRTDRGFAPTRTAHKRELSLSNAKQDEKIMTDAETLIACLYIKGFGKTEALSEALGEPAEAVDAVLAELVASGNAEQTRVGARLSAKGKVLAQEKLAAERASVDHRRLEEGYERFTKLNADFKALVTDWQMREIDGKRTRNDHKDEVYDTEVLSRLAALHALTVTLIADISVHAPRVGAYKRRLASALVKIEAKDPRYVTAPDRDSYHTIWFELHQHLINLLGTTREQEAAAGRAL